MEETNQLMKFELKLRYKERYGNDVSMFLLWLVYDKIKKKSYPARLVVDGTGNIYKQFVNITELKKWKIFGYFNFENPWMREGKWQRFTLESEPIQTMWSNGYFDKDFFLMPDNLPDDQCISLIMQEDTRKNFSDVKSCVIS